MKVLTVAIFVACAASLTPSFAQTGACINLHRTVDQSYLTIRADNNCGSEIELKYTETHPDGQVDGGMASVPKCQQNVYVYQTGPKSKVDVWSARTVNPDAPDCGKELPAPKKDDSAASRIKSRLKPAEQRAIAADVKEGDFYKGAYQRLEGKREADRKAAQAAAAAPQRSTPAATPVPSAPRCFESWATCRSTCQQVSQARNCPYLCSRNEHEEGGEIVGPFCY